MLAETSFVRKRNLQQHLADFRLFSKEPSKIGEKFSDFSISLVFGVSFGRPIWGKPIVGVDTNVLYHSIETVRSQTCKLKLLKLLLHLQ